MSLVCLIAHSLPPLFVKEGSIAHASHKNDGGNPATHGKGVAHQPHNNFRAARSAALDLFTLFPRRD